VGKSIASKVMLEKLAKSLDYSVTRR